MPAPFNRITPGNSGRLSSSAIGYSFPGLPCRARWPFRMILTSTPRRRAWMRASITLSWCSPPQLADQEQHQLDRMPGAMDLGNDGVMRSIELTVHRRVAPERVQEVEMAHRVDA